MPAVTSRVWPELRLEKTLGRLGVWLQRLVVGLAGAYILMLGVLMVVRASYPFELEWIEGVSLDVIRRILLGKPLYTAPSAEFLPLTYNPFYFLVSAGAARLVGLGFLAPRMVSILATMGCLFFCYRLVWEETHNAAAGWVAAGIYAASFRFAGAWMDLAKVDALFLCLLLAAFYFQFRRKGWQWQIVSSILWVMSYYTKQLALPVFGIMAFASLITSRGRSWVTWLSASALGALIFGTLDLLTAGWYSFYTVDILRYHHWTTTLWPVARQFVGTFWPALTIAVAYLAILWRFEQRSAAPIALLAATLLLASGSVFLKQWTYDNGFLPACLGMALLVGLWLGSTYKLFPPSSWKSAIQLVSLLLLIIQNGLLWFDPRQQIPTADNLAKTQRFVAFLQSLPGEVWVFSHGHFGYLAGKGDFLHSAPLGDLIGGAVPPETSDTFRRRAMARQVWSDTIHQQKADWVVSDKLDNPYFLPYYVIYSQFAEADIFKPVTGATSFPRVLLSRNPIVNGGELIVSQPVIESFFEQGWSALQDGVRWSNEVTASIQLSLNANRDYDLGITARLSCDGALPKREQIDVEWNDHLLGSLYFDACLPQTVHFDVPAPWIEAKSSNELRFVNRSAAFRLGLTSLALQPKALQP